jgi:hypothetical protein
MFINELIALLFITIILFISYKFVRTLIQWIELIVMGIPIILWGCYLVYRWNILNSTNINDPLEIMMFIITNISEKIKIIVEIINKIKN